MRIFEGMPCSIIRLDNRKYDNKRIVTMMNETWPACLVESCMMGLGKEQIRDHEWVRDFLTMFETALSQCVKSDSLFQEHWSGNTHIDTALFVEWASRYSFASPGDRPPFKWKPEHFAHRCVALFKKLKKSFASVQYMAGEKRAIIHAGKFRCNFANNDSRSMSALINLYLRSTEK